MKPKKKDGGDKVELGPLEAILIAYETSCRIGCKDFWTLSPFAFSVHLNAFNKEGALEQRVQSWHTWHSAALVRCNKMPKLDDFIGVPEETKAQIRERKLEAVLMARVKKNDG